jgi:hypothetical protein
MRALAIAQTEEWLGTPEGLAWLIENDDVKGAK